VTKLNSSRSRDEVFNVSASLFKDFGNVIEVGVWVGAV